LKKSLKFYLFLIISAFSSFTTFASTSWIPIMNDGITIMIPYTPELSESELVVYQDSNGNLYFKDASNRHLKLSVNSNNRWTITEITQPQWNSLNLSVSTYTLEFEYFEENPIYRISHNMLVDEVIVRYSSAGFHINSPVTLQYQYNSLGRLIKVINPENGDKNYEYDDAGNRLSVVKDNNGG
jgi:YD repeat-containing protein